MARKLKRVKSIIMSEKVKELLRLVKENPDLPIVPMVDCDVVGED